MSTQQLMIPNRIKVGFQDRNDTYTKKLAYVIYFDQKGVLRKEKSWESWRDKKITPVEFNNEPTEGFVLNKGVGGARQSYGWNARNEYIRVYDPRDFEFEISVANLLFILREGDCSRGKGLEGKFVYAWDYTSLVLLPVSSQDYQSSQQYTKLQTCKVKAKELVPGMTYQTKKQENLLFLGKFNYHFIVEEGYFNDCNNLAGFEKKFVFWDGKNFVFLKSLSSLATQVSDAIDPDYAKLCDKYSKSVFGSKITRLFTKPLTEKTALTNAWVVEKTPNVYDIYYSEFPYNRETKKYEGTPESEYHSVKLFTNMKGAIQKQSMRNHINSRIARQIAHNKFGGYYDRAYNQSYAWVNHYGEQNIKWQPNPEWIEPTNTGLYAETENGSVFRISSNGTLTKE